MADIYEVNWNLTEEVRVIPMDKKLLSDYMDACELIREPEQQISGYRKSCMGHSGS